MEMLSWGLVPDRSFCHHGPELLHVRACSVFLEVRYESFVLVVRVTRCQVSCESAYLLGQIHAYF